MTITGDLVNMGCDFIGDWATVCSLTRKTGGSIVSLERLEGWQMEPPTLGIYRNGPKVSDKQIWQTV